MGPLQQNGMMELAHGLKPMALFGCRRSNRAAGFSLRAHRCEAVGAVTVRQTVNFVKLLHSYLP